MKVVVLLLFCKIYDANSQNPPQKNLFQPAQSSYRSGLAIFEGSNPMRTNQGVFFQPATIWPKFGSGFDNLYEQVLNSQRDKRDAAGSLQIMTNHAVPIHADVKPEGAAVEVTEKPCPKSKYSPSHVENGVVFQVTAPHDTLYEIKSLRKSWPLPNKLELVRSISRVVTLAVLLISAVVEFFPLLKSLCSAVYSFIYL